MLAGETLDVGSGQVQDQRAEAQDPDAEAVADSMEEVEAEGEDDKIRSQHRYYDTVHRVKENVCPDSLQEFTFMADLFCASCCGECEAACCLCLEDRL